MSESSDLRELIGTFWTCGEKVMLPQRIKFDAFSRIQIVSRWHQMNNAIAEFVTRSEFVIRVCNSESRQFGSVLKGSGRDHSR